MVCQSCDHGQRYCAEGCRKLARKEAGKRANKKYQNSRQGRFKNAERQQRFRQRKKLNSKKVTDQGSSSSLTDDLLIEKNYPLKSAPKTSQTQSETVCHFCNRPCGPFFRGGFLKKRATTTYRSNSTAGEKLDDHQSGKRE